MNNRIPNDNALSQEELSRQDLPPKNANILWVERTTGVKKNQFLIYSPKIWGTWTHYVATKRQSKPCYKNRKLCYGGHSDETLRWYGYLMGWSKDRNRKEIIQLTVNAAHELLDNNRDGVSFRGLAILVQRSKHERGRMHAEVLTYGHRPPDDLPPPVDPLPSLKRMWKVDQDGDEVNHVEVASLDMIPSEDGTPPVHLKHNLVPYSSSNGTVH